MNTKELFSKLLKAGELAERLNFSKSGIYKLAAEGKIPHVKLGRSVRFDYQKVLAALQREINPPKPTHAHPQAFRKIK